VSFMYFINSVSNTVYFRDIRLYIRRLQKCNEEVIIMNEYQLDNNEYIKLITERTKNYPNFIKQYYDKLASSPELQAEFNRIRNELINDRS
jgi:hypothetical protein